MATRGSAEVSIGAVHVSALTHRYGNTEALSALDFDVAAGQVHAVLGPNGSGKTTLVRILSTLLAPTSGVVQVLGVSAASQPFRVRRELGVVMQDVGLDPLATGAEVLRLQARLRGFDKEGARRRARQLLDLLGIEEAADRLVSTYSGGMRRRLDLACALVHSPRALVLDEPTTGLDPLGRAGLWSVVTSLRQDGCAIVLTTQYLEEADELATSVSILNGGRLIARGAPAELKSSLGADTVLVRLRTQDRTGATSALASLPALSSVTTRPDGLSGRVEHGIVAAPEIDARLRAVQIVPLSINIVTATLDDVFERVIAGPNAKPRQSQTTAPTR